MPQRLSTALALDDRAIDTVAIAGQVTEQRVLYTALDAHVRHFAVRVPRDAVAHIDDDLAEAALRMMELNMRVDVVEAAECLRAQATANVACPDERVR